MKLEALAKLVKQSLEDWCATALADDDDHRTHLGASIIGRACERELWYSFRWFAKERFERFDRETGEVVSNEGRMRRLFARGHSEEERLVAMLRGIGCEVWQTDPATGKQFKFSTEGGHFGGSLDGVVRLPSGLGGLVCLLELKTIGEGPWKVLVKHGLDAAKPEHVAQFDTYGTAYELTHVLYVGVRKSTDELWIELREINVDHGKRMIQRGLAIVGQQTAPPRISATIEDQRCRFCSHKPHCRFDEPVGELNCRTCKFARPVASGGWHCDRFDMALGKETIVRGCSERERIA